MSVHSVAHVTAPPPQTPKVSAPVHQAPPPKAPAPSVNTHKVDVKA